MSSWSPGPNDTAKPGLVDDDRPRRRSLRVATWPERGLFIVAALLLIHPGVVTDLIGLALLAVVLGLQRMRPAVAAVAGVSR